MFQLVQERTDDENGTGQRAPAQGGSHLLTDNYVAVDDAPDAHPHHPTAEPVEAEPVAVVVDGEPGGDPDGDLVQRPNLSGDLELLMDGRPTFRSAVRGYDRLQVDNYVTWAEEELFAAQRQIELLLTRFGETSAELEIFRRRAGGSPELAPVSERLDRVLALAADEADELTAAGAAEAERLRADARAEAEERLRKVADLREVAAVAAEQARRNREEAAAELERARRDAVDLLQQAADERDRLAAEVARRLADEEQRARQEREAAAAEAAARLAAVEEEVADVRRQRDEARESLHRLTAQIGQALQAVTAAVPDVPSPPEEVVVRIDTPQSIA